MVLEYWEAAKKLNFDDQKFKYFGQRCKILRKSFKVLEFQIKTLQCLHTVKFFVNPKNNKPAVAVRKTTSADLGNPYKDAKNQLLRIEPLIVGGMLTKIGQKLFTH